VAYVRHSLQTGMLPVDGRVGSEIKKLYPGSPQPRERHRRPRQEPIDRIKTGDELPPGVIKLVKVYLASKRKISVGDKMAGRHGNKGVVAKIMPVEDMPFLADGTPVDVVLNPLGVPSRMNVGQILETHLGWAPTNRPPDQSPGTSRSVRTRARSCFSSSRLQRTENALTSDFYKMLAKMKDEEVIAYAGCHKGMKFATGFRRRKGIEIWDILEKAGLPRKGQTKLFDGRTGEPFDRDVTVGIIYMLKLAHLG
jgi:DNA-directed RNA polymerase subunit beta